MQRANTIKCRQFKSISQTHCFTVTLCKIKAPPHPNETGREGETGLPFMQEFGQHKVLLKLLTKIVKHFYNLTSSLTKGKSMKKIQKSKKVHYPVQYFALKSCHLQYMKNKPRSVITLKYTASIFQYFTHIFYSGRGDLLKTLLLKY